MKRNHLYVAALAAAGLISSASLAIAAEPAKSNDNTSGQQAEHKAAKPNVAVPDGWILVEEDAIVLTADEPQNHFLRAQQLLNQNQPRQAAGELRMAAAYLDMQASRGNGQDDDQQLSQQADNLRDTARQIQAASAEDQKKEIKEIDRDFQQADLALAMHLQMLSKSELARQREVMAGHDLQGSADALAAAYSWCNQQTPNPVSTEIQNAQRISDELITPREWAAPDSKAGAREQQDTKKVPAGVVAQPPQDAASCIDQFGQTIQTSQETLTKSEQASMPRN